MQRNKREKPASVSKRSLSLQICPAAALINTAEARPIAGGGFGVSRGTVGTADYDVDLDRLQLRE